jgi:hypothetical protein
MTIKTGDVRQDVAVAAAEAGNRPLTLNDVDRIYIQRNAAAAASTARDLWAVKNMMDLPETYRAAMPAESDPEKLMAAEQKIRQEYRADMKRHLAFHAGVITVNPDGSLRGPGDNGIRAEMGRAEALKDQEKATGKSDKTAEPPVDFSKLSSTEKMMLGMKQSAERRGVPQPELRPPVTTQAAGRTQGGAISTAGLTTAQKINLGLSRSSPARAPNWK